MSLVVKRKERNCRWCHKYALLQYVQPKCEVSLLPFWKVRFTAQERHPWLPRAHLSMQPNHRTLWKDVVCCSSIPSSFHSNSNSPKWQGCSTRNISNAVLSTLPWVRSLTWGFLETEGCQIISVLQYKQAASQATELKAHSFLQTRVCLFVILLPPSVLREANLALLFHPPS